VPGIYTKLLNNQLTSSKQKPCLFPEENRTGLLLAVGYR